MTEKQQLISVFKTYQFEIHNLSHSKRKKLLQTFKQSDMLYYKALAKCEEDARQLLSIETKKERKSALGIIQKKLQDIVKPLPFGGALKASIIETVKAQVSSFVELTLSGQDATYPTKENQEVDYQYWLNVLLQSTDKATEDAARDELSKRDRGLYRPLTFEKYRTSDGFMVLSDNNGRLFAFLNLWNAKDKRASALALDMYDTRTGEAFKTKTSTGMLLPLSFSEFQRNALVNGEAKTAKLVMRDERLFLMVSVKFEVGKKTPVYVMGIDQGIAEIATYTVRDPDTGKLIDCGTFSGATLKRHQQEHEAKQKADQKIGRAFIRGWSNYTTNLMHHVANEVVKIADKYSCQVVIEDLSNIKNNPKMKRPKFARKNNFRRMLSRQQYGRLESMLSYKLQSVGLPEPMLVWASYTSQTCPECGHSCKENRITRDAFQCQSCGFEQHADIVGALNIAGSYICFEKIKHKLKKGKPRTEELRYQNWLVDNLEI